MRAERTAFWVTIIVGREGADGGGIVEVNIEESFELGFGGGDGERN